MCAAKGHEFFGFLVFSGTRNKCIATSTSNKCLTSSNKKLLLAFCNTNSDALVTGSDAPATTSFLLLL